MSGGPPVLEHIETVSILHMGGLGDLVLLSGFAGSLRAAYPGAKITLVCRSSLRSVPSLYPEPPDEVVSLDLNPYLWSAPSPELVERLRPVIKDFKSRTTDIFFSGEHQLTWFSWLAAAALKPRFAVGNGARRPGGILSSLLSQFSLEAGDLAGPSPDTLVHELERYNGLLRFVGVKPRQFTPWSLPTEVSLAAEQRLREWDLEPGTYLVCFPMAVPSVPVKRWPSKRFLEVLKKVVFEFRLPIILTGDRQEGAELFALSQQLAQASGRVEVLAGDPDDIPLLAGLVARARAYLGNDTGPTHLAQACGVPGVAIHGGGVWPVYGPWGSGSVALVHPLPCFGCSWDCMFGHGFCVESVPAAAVTEALCQVIQGPSHAPEVRSLEIVPNDFQRLIADASTRYREAREVSQERLEALEACAEARQTIERAAQERAETLNTVVPALQQRIKDLERVAEERLQALETSVAAFQDVEAVSQERLEALEACAKARQTIERAAQERAEALNTVVPALQQRIEDLERVAEERLQALETSVAASQDVEAEARKRADLLVQLTQVIEDRDRKIAELAATREKPGSVDISSPPEADV